MNLINANELLSAGYTFTIEDENSERDFDTEGELRGVRFELPQDYYAADLPSDVDELGSCLCDTTELSDDKVVIRDHEDEETGEEWREFIEVGRWAHLADSHCEERAKKFALYLTLGVEGRMWREKEINAEWRYQRFERLSLFAERCKKLSTLYKLRSAVWRRYLQTTKACARTGDWWALYLTKDQVSCLMEYINQRIDSF